MKVLAIGGTGFVGSCVVRALRERGHDVWTLGRRPAGERHLTADRGARGALAQAVRDRRFEAVVDLAAYHPREVTEAAGLFRGSLERYVFVSSGVVHRDLHGAPAREEDAVVPEGTPPTSELDYTSGKRWCEAVLLRAKNEGFPAAVLRPPAVLGAGDPTNRVVAYLARIEDGGPLLLPEGLVDRAIGVVWSRDVGDVCTLLCERELPSFAYNVAFPGLTLRRFVEQSAFALGVAVPPIVEVGEPELAAAGLAVADVSPYGPSPERPGGYDLTRVRTELGFEPSPLAAALAETVAWFRRERPQHPGYSRRRDELRLAEAKAAT